MPQKSVKDIDLIMIIPPNTIPGRYYFDIVGNVLNPANNIAAETTGRIPLTVLSQSRSQRVVFHTKNQQPIKIDEFCIDINNLMNKRKPKSILTELNTISCKSCIQVNYGF